MSLIERRVRIPEEEMGDIEVAAAAAAGESVSEYVRKAIATRMEGQKQVEPSSSVSYTIPSVIHTINVTDNKSSRFQTRVPGVTTHAKNIRSAEDESLRQEA